MWNAILMFVSLEVGFIQWFSFSWCRLYTDSLHHHRQKDIHIVTTGKTTKFTAKFTLDMSM